MKITDDMIKKALLESKGIRRNALALIREWIAPEEISHTAVYKRIRESDELSEFQEELRSDFKEDLLDIYETQINNMATKGDKFALKEISKNIGRLRGYIERKELTGKDGETLAPQASGNYLEWLKEQNKQRAESDESDTKDSK